MTSIEELYQIFKRFPIVCHDSRNIVPNSIYWSLKGANFDGNTFAAQAFEKGAAYAVIDDPNYQINDKCLLVEDGLKALQDLATYHRKELKIPVIAIAGSNGKTTTKELMALVLNSKFRTFATPGNFNNHIGLPLSLLKISSEYEAAILELGANHPKENAFLCEICQPDGGVITNIGKDHLEGFGGIEGVEKANLELFDYLKAHDGLGFVNADDERIFKNVGDMWPFYYGLHEDRVANVLEMSAEVNSRFPLLQVELYDNVTGNHIEINSHLFGAFHTYNILAAASVGKYFGVSLEDIKDAIESYIPTNNRSQIISKDGNVFIMDAYNANPSSMKGGIEDFTDYPVERKVLILGDMFELGNDSDEEHKNIVEMIDKSAFDIVVLVGKEFGKLYREDGTIFFETTAQAKEWFKANKWRNSVFYLKGSRGMKLEQIIED